MRKSACRGRTAMGKTTRKMKVPRSSTLPRSKSEVIEQEPYRCTGGFKEDFPIVCQENHLSYIPAIVARPVQQSQVLDSTKWVRKPAKRTLTASKTPGHTSQAHRPKEKEDTPATEGASLLHIGTSADTTGPGEHEPEESITECPSDRFTYFKPCIQVHQENPKDDKTVTEIYIRGWKVDITMVTILSRCLPMLSSLRQLHLWRVGLDPETLCELALFLPRCHLLTTLVLDSNTLTGSKPSQLLHPGNHLNHLSLRFCGLTDTEVYGLGTSLGRAPFASSAPGKSSSSSSFYGLVPAPGLVTLNLTGNRIGDQGASYLADGLKVNRSLLVLNLSSNKIGNRGAACLATALSQFPVSKSELLERRRLISEKGSPGKIGKRRRPMSLRSIVSSTMFVLSGNHGRSNSRMKLRNKDKDKEVPAITKKDTPTSRKAPKDQRDKPKSPKPTRRRKETVSKRVPDVVEVKQMPSRRERKEKLQEEALNGEFNLNPLTDSGQLRDGELWLPANRTLLSLNLSRNAIGEPGFESLLAAVEDQAKPLHDSRRQTPGLGRLELHHNSAPDSCASAMEIRRYLRPRDPTLRSPRVDLRRANVTPCSVPKTF